MAALGIEPENRVRFAFWSGEEDGLIGSSYYVSQLTKKEIQDTALNLNFDMVGSTNAVNFVYDGDGDALGVSGPNGSGVIEDVFTDFFADQGESSEPTDFDGRSDYFGFIEAGIPAGGLFTGAEGIKSATQAAIYGGTAGEPYDPCYHAACDDITNIDEDTLDLMADAIAHATLTFAETNQPSTAPARARRPVRPTRVQGRPRAALIQVSHGRGRHESGGPDCLCTKGNRSPGPACCRSPQSAHKAGYEPT